VCDHIDQYYGANISGSPPVFWRFSEEILPNDCSIIQSDSDSGDLCHHLISNVGRKAQRRLIKDRQIGEFEICDNGSVRTLTQADIDLQLEQA